MFCVWGYPMYPTHQQEIACQSFKIPNGEGVGRCRTYQIRMVDFANDWQLVVANARKLWRMSPASWNGKQTNLTPQEPHPMLTLITVPLPRPTQSWLKSKRKAWQVDNVMPVPSSVPVDELHKVLASHQSS